MGRDYAALRLWSTVLIIVGIVGVVLVIIGTIVAMVQAVTFGQALAILLIGGPLAALFASWPIALGQGLEGSRRRRRVRPGAAEQGQVKDGNLCRATSRPSSGRITFGPQFDHPC